MAITQEQYDALNDGDHLIVAQELHAGRWQIYSGKVYTDHLGVKQMPTGFHNIFPTKGGKYTIILEHTKPDPEFWDARAIEYEDKVWIRYIISDKRAYLLNTKKKKDALWRSETNNIMRNAEFDEDKVTILLR